MRTIRIEYDSLGPVEVPAAAYYGAQTMRAVRNYRITGTPISAFKKLIHSLALIKKAAARANHELGLLDAEKAEAVVSVCDQLLAGEFRDQFVVDIIQGGAGTSTNMNANEVIANAGLEFMGHPRAEYEHLDPNRDVNMSQSTNDVYPTAIRMTLMAMIVSLVRAMDKLQKTLWAKSEEFHDVIKMGRTQLQDAVPMTLGQEFASYSIMVQEDMERLMEARDLIREVNMGATAIGTGLNAHPRYQALVMDRLREVSSLPLIAAKHLVEATQDTGAYVQLSGVLKRVAVKLSKICNDLRLLSSGPRCGLNEINLPPMAPGSSIMPGKVNPVIPEVVNQVAFQVAGSDMAVTMACEAGQLELNVMEPVIAANLFTSLTILKRACRVLALRCVSGITANRDRCRAYVENSIGLVTALSPYIGYRQAAAVAHQALETGESVYGIVLRLKLMTRDELDDLLRPENMTAPRLPLDRL